MNRKFYIFLTILTFLVFILNVNHLNQQLIYERNFLPAAENLLEGNGFTHYLFQGKPAFYPMWGYSILLIPDAWFNTNGLILLFFQALMCISGIYYFYRLFKIEPQYFHLFLHIPFIALMSVKWPDGITAYLIIVFYYYFRQYLDGKKFRNLIIAGVLLGLMINFRTEYIVMPFFSLVLILFPGFKQYRKQVWVSIVALSLLAGIFISPWAVRAYNTNGKISLTTSNFGIVGYVSLGTLKSNPWGVYLHEYSAYDYLWKRGVTMPYSVVGDSLLTDAYQKAVRDYPLDYMKKNLYNFCRNFTDGVYTGEYGNIIIDPHYRYDFNEKLKLKGNSFNQLIALFDYDPGLSVPILFEKFIQFLFMPVNFLIYVGIIILGVNFKKLKYPYVFVFISAFALYKIAMTSIYIYEPRFVNIVYYMFAGLVISEKEIFLNMKLFKKIAKKKA